MGKRIFDEVIRKVLSPLNIFIYSPDDFWGYDLTVEGKTKDFLEKPLKPTTVIYRFLILLLNSSSVYVSGPVPAHGQPGQQ